MSGARDELREIWRTTADFPTPARLAVVGATILGLVGGVAGVVIGLFAYPPTAYAAAVEVGLPAALIGGLVGAGAGSSIWLLRRLRRASHGG